LSATTKPNKERRMRSSTRSLEDQSGVNLCIEL